MSSSAVQTSSIEAQTSIQEAEEYRSAHFFAKAQTTYNREVSVSVVLQRK